MKKYFYRPEGAARGVTLLELLVVITIIGILVLISLPNIMAIIASHRIRSSANDLLTKTRSVRSLAISKRRPVNMYMNLSSQSFIVVKPKHTEYDLLKDISGAILASPSAYPNLSSFILFEEDPLLLGEMGKTIHIGDTKNNGIDKMLSDCPAKGTITVTKTVGTSSETFSFSGTKITFNPSGTIEPTCSFTIKDTRYDRQYQLKLYKGGQIVLR